MICGNNRKRKFQVSKWYVIIMIICHYKSQKCQLVVVVIFVLNIFLFLFLFFLAVVHSLSSLSSLRSTSLRVAGVFLTFLPSSSYFPSLSWFLIVFFSSSFQHVPFRSDSSSASVLFAECEDVAKDLTDRRRPSTSISTQLPSWWSTLRLHYAIKNHFSPFQFHRTTIKPSKTQ